ncbi:predicted permeases of the drug/metabolite transporter (DMT) superfamily [Phenylobacterium zucineum HLK1]|uniref:Predicted permeases of the drug/metabolite transporter (DMT) superfamily n=2 Tax=Phenylobacterium zucineum TaxID=284016 RepID=B4RAM4_PHEZH|nr:predicted permeases of the drug/metabolite transporter (DMT) superfamily [Phenylobacterium zucineum HLK1]
MTGGMSRRAQGVLMMALAMFIIPAVDGLAKHLSSTYSPLMIGWVSFAASACLVTPVAVRLHGLSLLPQTQRRLHLLRLVFLLAAATLYYMAIARIPLATAVSAYFIGPVVAALLAVVVLKERMTPAKLASLALGVGGAAIILQPGGGAIEPGLLLAFGSGVAYACFQVVTRKIAEGSSPFQTLAFQYLVGLFLLAPQAALNWTTPRVSDLWLFAAMGTFGVLAHVLSVLAFRRAEASTLAPLSYLELLGSAAIGYLAFGDVPGGPVLIGAALIVSAGALLLPRRAVVNPAPGTPAA